MSGKTLKFGNYGVNEKEFHASKKPITINLVDIRKIFYFYSITFYSKYFIGCTDDNIIRPSCLAWPQMSGYIKYFDDGGKICLLKLKMITHW